MKWQQFLVLVTSVVLGGGFASATPLVIDFDTLTYGTGSVTGPTGSYFNGGGQSAPWVAGQATFNNFFLDYGGGYTAWYGWAYSNINDTVWDQAGGEEQFENQYAAWPGADASGTGNYAIVFDDGYSGEDHVAHVDLPANYRPHSMLLANTTYAAIVMQNGSQFSAAFTSNDHLRLTVTAWSDVGATGTVTGTATFDLYGPAGVKTGWNELSLAEISGSTRSLSFAFADSQSGAIPAYAAVDNLTLVAVPEPSAGILLACGGVAAWIARRRVRTA